MSYFKKPYGRPRRRLSNSMEQSPSWEANSHSDTLQIPRVLRNQKVHNTHRPPLVPTLNQMHPAHNFSPYFPTIHSNIIFPSAPSLSEWSVPFRSSTKILYAFLISAHLIHLDFTATIKYGEAYKLWSSSLCSILQPPSNSTDKR